MTVKNKDKLYYARVMPSVFIYDICDLVVRTVEDTWFVGVDKRDKHAYIFRYEDIGNVVFLDRKEALEKVLEEERKNKGKYKEDLQYEKN